MDDLKISVSPLWVEQNDFFSPPNDLVCSCQTVLCIRLQALLIVQVERFISAIYNQVFTTLLANRNVFKTWKVAPDYLPTPTLNMLADMLRCLENL